MTLVEIRKNENGLYGWKGDEITTCILAKYFHKQVLDDDLIPTLSELVDKKIITSEQKEIFYKTITKLDVSKGTKKDLLNMLAFSDILDMDIKIYRKINKPAIPTIKDKVAEN